MCILKALFQAFIRSGLDYCNALLVEQRAIRLNGCNQHTIFSIENTEYCCLFSVICSTTRPHHSNSAQCTLVYV